MSILPDVGGFVRQVVGRPAREPGAPAPVAPPARDVANRPGRWTWEGYAGGTVAHTGVVDVAGDGQLRLFIDSNVARFDALRLLHEGGAVLDCYRDGTVRVVRAGADPEPGLDNPDDRTWNAAVAKFPAVTAVAGVALEAAVMLANYEAGEGDDDAEDLLTKLTRKLAAAAEGLGITPAAKKGDVVPYDPERHWHVGSGGENGPPAGTMVRVVSEGQAWNHGGPAAHIFHRAFTVFTDDEHGDHIITTPRGLDEEVEEPGTQSVWMEFPELDALEEGYDRVRAEHPEVPATYCGPDWYDVDAVSDCGGDDDECPNGPGCDGRWLFFDRMADDGGVVAADQPIHFDADAQLRLAYSMED